jgi:DNA helicase HerA-like ATPase
MIMQARKYGLGFMIVSQRTAVVSKSALSQCESYAVFRTVDDTSLTYLETLAGPIVRDVVPALGRYEMLCLDPAFNTDSPVVVAVSPDKPEDADDNPDF